MLASSSVLDGDGNAFNSFVAIGVTVAPENGAAVTAASVEEPEEIGLDSPAQLIADTATSNSVSVIGIKWTLKRFIPDALRSDFAPVEPMLRYSHCA